MTVAVISSSAIVGFAVTMVLALVLLWTIAVILMANARLRPPRMTDGKALSLLGRLSPQDLSLPYECELFEVPETVTGQTLRLHAWWVPHPQSAGRCVILLHGYADAKVGALAWLPLLHDAQVNVLLLDQRAHGQSSGKYCTAGFYERHDLSCVIDQLRKARPAEATRIAILGVSMGGVTAMAVGALRCDLAGIIVDSPFGDYTAAGLRHAQHFGFPGGFILCPATWLAARIARVRFDEVAPLRTVAELKTPMLLIQPANDMVISPADAAELRRRLADNPLVGARSQSVLFENTGHVLGLRHDPERYRNQVTAFIEQTMPAHPATA